MPFSSGFDSRHEFLLRVGKKREMKRAVTQRMKARNENTVMRIEPHPSGALRKLKTGVHQQLVIAILLQFVDLDSESKLEERSVRMQTKGDRVRKTNPEQVSAYFFVRVQQGPNTV